MEELLLEVERRAVAVKEQQEEYETIKAAYDRVSNTMEALAADKRRLEAAAVESEATARRNERERRSLELQVKDLGQQVSRLLYEAQRGPDTVRVPSPAVSQFSGGNASDVTTQLLVEFKDVEELQQQNLRLLRVNRELSQAAEATKAEAEEALRREYQAQIAHLSDELGELRRSREKAEDLLLQVQRQRDTLRQMLKGTDGNGDLGEARVAYARSLDVGGAGLEAELHARGHSTNNMQREAVGGPNYHELYVDLDDHFKQFREEANKNQNMLAQDLARAKEDAATAKSEAARSGAQAEFEKERSNRLSASLEAQREQVESLMASNAKYQALITETERRLHAVQAAASEAQDTVRRESTRAENLEAEKRLLEAAEKRLSQEAAELSNEKFRLAAELEATRKLHIEREEEWSSEGVRLREEVARATQSLADALRELAVARQRAESAAHAAETTDAQATEKLARMEGELRETQTALSTAQQRASAAEAKVDLLQEAVRKAEERVARLEMERSSRMVMSEPSATPSATVQPAGFSHGRESELTAELKLLREELITAQEAAAAATGHAKQFELLARTAEEALKSVQGDHEKFKREAAARIAAANENLETLRASLTAKEAEVRETKQAEKEFAAECERLDGEFAAERSALQAAIEQAREDGKQDREQVQRLIEDVEAVRRQLADAKRSYDAEVMAHGDALRRLAAADSSVMTVQERLAAVTADLDSERSLRQQIESELRSQISELEIKASETARQAKTLSEQRAVLQEQLEKLAASSGEEGGDFANALRLLRQEREAAEINLALAERELVRLRQEAVTARRAAEEARAQLAAESERSRSAVRDEAGQEELLQKVEQFNLLRESNAALRADNVRAQKLVQELQGRVRTAEAALAPLQGRVRSLEAAQEAAGAELAAAREQAERWQKRTQQLMQKYESVDVGEYQRVAAELKTAQQAMKAAEETAAERQHALEALRQQLATSEQRAASSVQRAEGTEKSHQDQLTKLKADLDAARAENENSRKRATSLWTTVCSICNREKKSLAEWKIIQAQKETRLLELEEKVKVLDGEGGSDAAKTADVAALRARVTQLEGEVAAAEERAANEIKTAKARQLELAKKAAAGKQAVVQELQTTRQQLAAAQKLETDAEDRLAKLESEKSALQSSIQTLEAQLAACKEELNKALAAKKELAPRGAAARQVAKTQIAAIQQQAINELKSRLKRKPGKSRDEDLVPGSDAADDHQGESVMPAAKKTRLRADAPPFAAAELPTEEPEAVALEEPETEAELAEEEHEVEDEDAGPHEGMHEEPIGQGEIEPEVQEIEEEVGAEGEEEEEAAPEEAEGEGEEEFVEHAEPEQVQAEMGSTEEILHEDEGDQDMAESAGEGEPQVEEGEHVVEGETVEEEPRRASPEAEVVVQDEEQEHGEEQDVAIMEEEEEGAGETEEMEEHEVSEGKKEEEEHHDGESPEVTAPLMKIPSSGKIEVSPTTQPQSEEKAVPPEGGTEEGKPKKRAPIAWVPPARETPTKPGEKPQGKLKPSSIPKPAATQQPQGDDAPPAMVTSPGVAGRAGIGGRAGRGTARGGAPGRSGRGRGRIVQPPPPPPPKQ